MFVLSLGCTVNVQNAIAQNAISAKDGVGDDSV